jgi:hypothetical protein
MIMRLRIWLGLGATALLAGCPFPDAPHVQGIGGGGSGGGSGDRLSFLVQPSNAFVAVAISPSIQVTAIDTTTGLVDTSFTGVVTMALSANPTGAVLSGTKSVNAISGIAFFPDLTVSLAGTGYTLVATNSNLGSVTSSTFDITTPP